MRARIEEAWGARAFDHAGMTEMGAYGFECAEQAGLHVNESEFIAEVIDPGHRRARATEGELVLTNLGRARLAAAPLPDRATACALAERRARAAGRSCASRAASWAASTTC